MCFAGRNLPVAGRPTTLPSNLFDSLVLTALDPLVQCRSPAAYKEAVLCMLDRMKTCCDPPHLVGHLPDPQRMLQGMDLMCSQYYAANAECFRKNYNRIIKCGRSTVNRLLIDESMVSLFSPDVFTCLMADISYDCTHKIIGESCDSFTVQAYLTGVRLYFVPRACLAPDKDPGREDRPRYVEPPDLIATDNSIPAEKASLLLTGLLAFVGVMAA